MVRIAPKKKGRSPVRLEAHAADPEIFLLL